MTLAFAVAMAIVLFVVGTLIYVRYRNELDSSIDRGLRSRAGDVETLLRESNGATGVLPVHAESLGEDNFAQILTESGRVVDTTGGPTERAVLDRVEVREAAKRPVFVERDHVPGLDSSARLLATSAGSGAGRGVIVVGSSLDDRNEALRHLATLLWLGGAVALLLSAAAGYLAVSASLRPVEAIRRRADEISSAGPSQRLPVPPAKDELRRLGQTLNEMLGRLEAALERERAFVDDASHELRTPLAMHRAELEIALRHGSDVDELRAAIASAIEEVDRLSALAEDLLVLARSDKGQMELQVEPIQVEGLLDSLRDRFASRALALGRTLQSDSVDGGFVVLGDRLRLEQALANMLNNALLHGDGPIRISASRQGERVRLHVSDEGSGFAANFLPHAFERFTRADDARTGGGTGLGLAIVEAIAKAHDGSAGAVNDANGADVWIELSVR